ncbi:MAG: D-aminoacyl-tRNA deacylase [Candidatus Micrarchaeaceae archaeon]
MVCFVFCDETASSNIAAELQKILGLGISSEFHGLRHLSSSEHDMIEIRGRLIDADFLDSILEDTAIFLSRHSSSKGIASFTVHATGNWSEDVSLGGRPKSLSVSAPLEMANILRALERISPKEIDVTYEATHHGPLLDKPSLFVELGGNEDMISSRKYANLLATAVSESFDIVQEYGKVAFGIGGMHYSDKFTRLATSGKYAFSHIMPKYHADCVDMILKGLGRSNIKADIALIEWKSIKASDRENIVRELNLLGIDYAKV